MICSKVIHNRAFDFDNDILDHSNLIIIDLMNAYSMSATVLRTRDALFHVVPKSCEGEPILIPLTRWRN